MGEAILAVGAGERPASFEQFSAAIDPAWIAHALAATGTASVRRRKLPAEHVVWLVIVMGCFVEGLNNKLRVIQRGAYGLCDEEYLRLKILTCMLPEV